VIAGHSEMPEFQVNLLTGVHAEEMVVRRILNNIRWIKNPFFMFFFL